jgi:hypothetical protein
MPNATWGGPGSRESPEKNAPPPRATGGRWSSSAPKPTTPTGGRAAASPWGDRGVGLGPAAAGGRTGDAPAPCALGGKAVQSPGVCPPPYKLAPSLRRLASPPPPKPTAQRLWPAPVTNRCHCSYPGLQPGPVGSVARRCQARVHARRSCHGPEPAGSKQESREVLFARMSSWLHLNTVYGRVGGCSLSHCRSSHLHIRLFTRCKLHL